MDAPTRELVQQISGQRCEVCHLPESALPYLVFRDDHMVAKQHLDDVSDDPQSLAWAGNECNYHKGPNLVSIDPRTKQQVELFNPRMDDWNLHFAVDNAKIVGLTPAGRATARLLYMNAPRLVRLRHELIDQGQF